MKRNIVVVVFLLIVNFTFYLHSDNTPEKLSGTIIGTERAFDYSSSSCTYEINTKENAFDGNLETIFASCERSGTWVGLDLGEAHVITKVAFCPRKDEPSPRMLLGVFEGANNPDFGDAIPIYMITEAPEKNKLTEKDLACSRAFRYVRYVGPNDVKCNLAELEFYGYKSSGSDSKLYQLTKLPTVSIHTVNAEDIVEKEKYINGIISIISEDGTVFFSDSLEIRGRGNSSWTFPKKPYRIKLYNKANLLAQPAKEKSWTLINNYGDKTLMRNLLAFDLSKRFEMPYTPAAVPVDVYLNGEYKGCYQLCDHVQAKEHRVSIKEMKPTDIDGEKLTGGYFLEIDNYAYEEASWFESARNLIPVTIKSPDEEEIVALQKAYIKSHFDKFEAAVYSSNYTDPVEGYRKYLDVPTFIRHFLIGELAGNTDTYWSTYVYKQRSDDKFYVGPVWDFDIAYENDFRTYPINNLSDYIYKTKGSHAGQDKNKGGMRDLVNRILSDNSFQEELKNTYAQYRKNGAISEETLLSVVDAYAEKLDESQKLNFKRWDIMSKWIHMNPQVAGSYQGEVNNVKKYIKDRIKWMDKKMNYSASAVENIDASKIYCWTDDNILNIEMLSENAEIKIFTATGSLILNEIASGRFEKQLNSGIYIIRINDKNDGLVSLKTIIL